jgi:hypothetical protein
LRESSKGTASQILEASYDPELVCIYRYVGHVEHTETQVDVQLVQDYSRREAIVDIISNNLVNILTNLPKYNRSQIWTALYTAYVQGGRKKKGIRNLLP